MFHALIFIKSDYPYFIAYVRTNFHTYLMRGELEHES